METLAQGDVLLDKYTVERKIGRGGMGTVVAVRHRHLGEVHALKFMTGVCTPETMERFWREGRAGAQLRGQHVAHVHDLGKLPNGLPYMVMEYLQGSDLKTLLHRDGPFPVADAIRYVLQTCEALAEAHDAGIIHRDIKPSNLFLWERPYGEPCIKVLDFGISKHRYHDDDDALTLTKGFLGSPQYMSPEQIASPKNVDARADIWSLGVVLYEILVGTAPFRASTIVGVINQVAKDEPKPPRHYRPTLPASLELVVMRCLRKSPEDRFQQIEELAAALLEVHEEVITSLTSTVSERAIALPVPTAEGAPLGPEVEKATVLLGAKLHQGSTAPLPDPTEVPTTPVRERLRAHAVSNPIDGPTLSVDGQAIPRAGADALDTTTRKVLAESEPDVDIVLPEKVVLSDSAELAPFEKTQTPIETGVKSGDEYGLQPRRWRSAGIAVGLAAVLAAAALVFRAYWQQSSTSPTAASSEIVPKQNVAIPPPTASAPTSANPTASEITEAAPGPPTSTSKKPEKTKTINTTPRDSRHIAPTSPAPRALPPSSSRPAPAPQPTTADKPVPSNDTPHPSNTADEINHW